MRVSTAQWKSLMLIADMSSGFFGASTAEAFSLLLVSTL